MLLLLGRRHTPHQNRLGGIYTISEVVCDVVLIPVNSECHLGSVSLTGSNALGTAGRRLGPKNLDTAGSL
jgi:hypothetical protein